MNKCACFSRDGAKIHTGAAWLSSARVVRCLVKSYNERNPRFVLLRHALTDQCHRPFSRARVSKRTLGGKRLFLIDDTPMKAGACCTHKRLPVICWRKVGMTSSPHGPYGLGHTRATMAMTMGSKAVRRSESGKIASVRIVLCNSRT